METTLQPGATAYAIYNPQYDGGFGFYVREIKICREQYESPENPTPPDVGMVWVTQAANGDEAFNARQLIHERGVYVKLEDAKKALGLIGLMGAVGYKSEILLHEPRKLLKSDSRIQFRENPFVTGEKMILEARYDGQVNKTALYIHSGAAQYPEILHEFRGEPKDDLAFVKEAIIALKEYEKELKLKVKK